MKIIRTKHFIALSLFIASNFTYAQKHLETNKNNPILKETQLSPSEKASVIIQSKGNFNTWKEQVDAAQSGGFKGILKKIICYNTNI